MFGFPHPNGFAIEPQFMGNLLLAPAIIAAWLYLKRYNKKKLERECSRGVVLTTGPADSAPNCSLGSSSVPVVKATTGSRFLGSNFFLLCFFVIAATLFLTFSRGAIYAFAVATVFMSAFVVVRNRKERRTVVKRVGVMWLTVVGAFLFTLNLQGVMAQVSPTNDTYFDGVAKVVNHLTLGIVEIRGGEKGASDNSPSEKIQALEPGITGEDDEFDENGVVEKPVENFVENEAVFDGYVEESTEVRKRLTRDALTVWRGDFVTVMFGVGIGGAGQALYVNGLTDSPKEIVQNQYASLLLEVGAAGVSLFVLAVVLAVRAIWEKCPVEAGAILTLLVAYGVTLLFFSGVANALQIYLLPGILMVILRNDRVKAAE